MFCFRNHAENKAGRLVGDLIFYFRKTFYDVTETGLYLRFNIF